MADLVTIEDSTILTLVNDSKISQEIPCLFNKAQIFNVSTGGCGACARKKQQRVRDEMAKIKSCLAALSPENKLKLKQYFGANKIRVVYTRAGGEIVQLTF